MRGFDFTAGRPFAGEMPAPDKAAEYAVICDTADVRGLSEIFGWDESTLLECTNIDENVRYTSYDGYDFISLIYIEDGSGPAEQRELNVFFSRHYLVLVMPEQAPARLSAFEQRFGAAIAAAAAAGRPSPLPYLYYQIFDNLAADFSESLEKLEDEMEALSEAIEAHPSREQSAVIARYRKTAYTYKKLLRAFSYIGGQILMDENKLLGASGIARYFRSVDTRLDRLYDFADNLFVLSTELLHIYDSKFSAQMNETVNKLTIITLFFGPLTVIAGIYGMNFNHMPELGWTFGYPASIALMALVSVGIFVALKLKKWL